MLSTPVACRLAQRTLANFPLNKSALFPTATSAGSYSKRWQHSHITGVNGQGSSSASSGTNDKQAGQSFGYVDNDKSNIAHASGKSSGGGRVRKSLSLALFAFTFSAVGAYASWYTLRNQGMGFYSDEESLNRFSPTESDAEARRIAETINNHPMVAELRQRPELTESRPHMKMPSQYRARSLTGSALTGPGKVPIPAYAWIENGGKSLVSVVYVGADLCGHPGIVHGGFLATMLDEGLARCCFGALPHNIGVTANLNINYRKPTPAATYLVLRAETTKVEGRKAWVKGQIESMPGPGETPTVYAEATALFVSPKFAAKVLDAA
ncbi:hypothetical protein QQS21_002377 [Conoideocrella luteorostrata]|uniref:Thioesterase domain-containing protein n=1 Tax=Conoideocrella luteorostrata TaxID=1105319 RepID=A0AAJ0CV46_9HYPO|nr:hypothetical protein QQS21_002377 [Conoideocrella luteorostrata]